MDIVNKALKLTEKYPAPWSLNKDWRTGIQDKNGRVFMYVDCGNNMLPYEEVELAQLIIDSVNYNSSTK